MIDLLAGGQGMFGIALGSVWRDIAGGELHQLPTEKADSGEAEVTPVANDELAQRRARRIG